jgi:predicted RNA-binding Zn-ribbon protein involved in translation (DUF1610 family)
MKLYCKACNIYFKRKKGFINGKCPKCGAICNEKNYVGVLLKGLPTVKR